LWAQGSFWRVKDGARLMRLESVLGEEAPPYVPSSVSFSPDGKMLAIGYLEGHLQLWDLGEEKLIRELEGYQGGVLDLAFSPDGKTLAAIFGYPDIAIQLWTVPEGERLFSIKGHEWTYEFSQVVFSPDGQTLATVSKNEDGMDLGMVAELWRAADGERLYQLDMAGVTRVAFSKDGYLLGSYRIATAPEPNSSRLTSFKSTCFDSPANNVGPWPASLGCTTNSYSSINPSSANASGSVTPPTNSPLPGSRLSC
jgi:WD40 repeat protein